MAPRKVCSASKSPMINTVPPSVSMYLGAKPSQSFSPVPASTSATSSSEVLRRSARNSEMFRKRFTVLLQFQRVMRLGSSWQCLLEDFRDHVFSFGGAILVFVPDDEAVRENFVGEGDDLGGCDGRIAFDGSHRLRGAEQSQRAARAGTEQQGGMPARRADERENVIARGRIHLHVAHGFLAFRDSVGCRHRLKRFNRMLQLKAFDHLFFIAQIW